MNKEVIISELLKQRQGEEDSYAYQKAVARADVEVTGIPYKIFWLYNSELNPNVGSYDKQRFIFDKTQAFGIAKNSKLGEVIIKRQDGTYTTDKGVFNVTFKSLTTYTPTLIPNIDAINGSIEIQNKKPFLFRSAFALMNMVDEPVGEDYKLSILHLINDQIEADVLGKELSLAEQEQSRNLYETTRYILENNELRQQPILDATQEEIKRSKIFNGVIIINGGPGTGKTTILIQRIKFLLDPTICEYWPQGEKILPELEGNNGWIFFSPNQLLLGFLQNAMVNEGLKASSNRCKVWHTFINSELLIRYELIGPGKPFQLYRQPIGPLLNNEPHLLRLLLADFEEFILKQLTQRIKKSCQAKIYTPELKKDASSLILNAKSLIDAESVVRFVQLSDDLADNFREDFKLKVAEINVDLQKYTDIVFVRLKREQEKYKIISAHLKDVFEKNIDGDDDADIDDDLLLELKPINYNESLVIRKYIKLWLRKYFLNNSNAGVPINEKHKKWITIISDYCTGFPLKDLGNKLLFIKNISPLVAGSSLMFFNRFGSIYKLFRKTLPLWFERNGMLKEKERMELLLKQGEARIHYDERCFLILSINTIIRILQKNNAAVFASDANPFIAAYKAQQRYIIGVDEASDFSLIELACMHSFSHPLYNCTTFSGDLMQRMTKEGISDWKKVTEFLEEGDIKSLQISYRQSATLLDLAKKFYENVTKKKAKYTSYTNISPYEPKPVLKKIDDHEMKINWIAENILLIYKSYGNKIPSIAIFLPEMEGVLRITNDLKNCDLIADLGIDVQAVSDNGGTVQKGKVGVYPIENIKGLEFEAVFFIDIDLIENTDKELLQKYVYVGLSRAAYYLFLSYTKSLPKGLDFLHS